MVHRITMTRGVILLLSAAHFSRWKLAVFAVFASLDTIRARSPPQKKPRIPSAGLRFNDANLEMAYPSVDDTNLYAISTSPAVGSFIDADNPTKIEFLNNNGLRAGGQAFVRVTFKAAMEIAKDELVEVTLPRYTGASIGSIDVVADSAENWAASWDLSTQVGLALGQTIAQTVANSPVRLQRQAWMQSLSLSD